MIIGIGTDIVSIARIENLTLKFGDKFLTKIFTENEINNANKINVENNNFLARVIFYAKRFAAKEAFSKACGIGIGRGINFCDIEIFNDELGKPHIKLLNEKTQFFHDFFGSKKINIHLSISDEMPLAHAFVVIEKA